MASVIRQRVHSCFMGQQTTMTVVNCCLVAICRVTWSCSSNFRLIIPLICLRYPIQNSCTLLDLCTVDDLAFSHTRVGGQHHLQGSSSRFGDNITRFYLKAVACLKAFGCQNIKSICLYQTKLDDNPANQECPGNVIPDNSRGLIKWNDSTVSKASSDCDQNGTSMDPCSNPLLSLNWRFWYPPSKAYMMLTGRGYPITYHNNEPIDVDVGVIIVYLYIRSGLTNSKKWYVAIDCKSLCCNYILLSTLSDIVNYILTIVSVTYNTWWHLAPTCRDVLIITFSNLSGQSG